MDADQAAESAIKDHLAIRADERWDFRQLLDLLERRCPGALDGVDQREYRRLHSVRNDVVHRSGTPAREDAERYISLAGKLLTNLYQPSSADGISILEDCLGILADIARPGLAVLFVGEAVGEVSEARGHYYADRTNDFWRDLAAVGITPRPLGPDDDTTLLEHGVGLTDVVKHRNAKELKAHPLQADEIRLAAAALRRKLTRWQPGAVCFLGKEPARACFGWRDEYWPGWGHQPSVQEPFQVWLCHSTSGSARRYRETRRGILRDLYDQVILPWHRARKSGSP